MKLVTYDLIMQHYTHKLHIESHLRVNHWI